MSLLVEQLEANGLSFRQVVDARVFLAGEDPKGDDRGVERAWKRGFEPIGQRPNMNMIPSRRASGLGGIMTPDLIIEIDLIAHRGHGGESEAGPGRPASRRAGGLVGGLRLGRSTATDPQWWRHDDRIVMGRGAAILPRRCSANALNAASTESLTKPSSP